MSKPENPLLFDMCLQFEDGMDDNVFAPYTKITLRDIFAGMAMQGLILARGPAELRSRREVEARARQAAEGAYIYADAMLCAREETK